jgi:dTDP-glucose 4,6-dehydratase
VQTYGLDARITRCCNNYGPNQFPEKFIPLAIKNLKENKKIPIYGDGKNIREWIHVEDHCRGIQLVIDKGKRGEIYNIGSSEAISNLDLAKKILEFASKGVDSIEFVEDRKGHDIRYNLNSSFIQNQLNFQTSHTLVEGIRELVNLALNRNENL